MQAVNVLGDDAGKLSAFLHLRQFLVGDVRLDVPTVHFLTIILEKHFRLVIKTAVTQEIFRRIFVELDIMLVI